MPTYEFICETCTKNNKKFVFEQTLSITQKTEGICPVCKNKTTKQVFGKIPFVYGLTASEKIAGTTKNRYEMGKYLREERRKRKKNAKPGTKDAESNELWTGTEHERGIIKPNS